MKLNFWIHGMQAENQVLEFQESMMKMEGVEDIKINFPKRRGVITLDDSVEEQQIKDRIELMGFEVFQVLR